MPIVYVAVFDENKVRMAECPKSADDPQMAKKADVVQKIVATLPSAMSPLKRNIEDSAQGLSYGLLCSGNGRIVVAVSTLDVRSGTMFALLEAVEPLVRCPASELRNGKKLLQMKMDFYNNPQNDRIASLAHDIDVVIESTAANIEKAVANNNLVDVLQGKTVTIAQQSKTFQDAATEVRDNLCKRNAKTIVMFVVGAAVASLFVAMVSCRPNFSACRN